MIAFARLRASVVMSSMRSTTVRWRYAPGLLAVHPGVVLSLDFPSCPTVVPTADDSASAIVGAVAMRAASASEKPRDASTQYANTRSKSTEFAPAVTRTRSGWARSYAALSAMPRSNVAPEQANVVAVAPNARATISPYARGDCWHPGAPPYALDFPVFDQDGSSARS